MPTVSSMPTRFHALHGSGTFVMPNPYDVGSARLLASMGFPALATTSSGFAATLGRMDMNVTLDELLAHASAIAGNVDVPLNVDAERCFGDDADGVHAAVEAIGRTGAGGCSIEDWDPAQSRIEPFDSAVERVRAAVAGAGSSGMVVTARCENLLRGVTDLDETTERLRAYQRAGAHCVYAPGLADLATVLRVVGSTDAPVNVLLRPDGPTVAELASAGVRRISVGGALAWAAFGAMLAAAQGLLDEGRVTPPAPLLARGMVQRAFGR